MTTLLELGAVTVAGYRLRTNDNTSAAHVVTGALTDAEHLLEEELRRELPLAQRTETMRIHGDGRVYPLAYPLISCTTNTIDGRSLVNALPDIQQFTAFFPYGVLAPRATITYTGGFDDATFPTTLRHALYDLAAALAGDASPVPVGAQSVHVGDVSVSYGAGATPGEGVDAYLPGLALRVRKYRNRFVAAFPTGGVWP
jgi:hypothetical protein